MIVTCKAGLQGQHNTMKPYMYGKRHRCYASRLVVVVTLQATRSPTNMKTQGYALRLLPLRSPWAAVVTPLQGWYMYRSLALRYQWAVMFTVFLCCSICVLPFSCVSLSMGWYVSRFIAFRYQWAVLYSILSRFAINEPL